MSYAGFIGVTVVLDARGRPVTDPIVHTGGMPEEVGDAARQAGSYAQDRFGKRIEDEARAAEEIRRAVRRGAQDVWGKKPLVKVEVTRLD